MMTKREAAEFFSRHGGVHYDVEELLRVEPTQADIRQAASHAWLCGETVTAVTDAAKAFGWCPEFDARGQIVSMEPCTAKDEVPTVYRRTAAASEQLASAASSLASLALSTRAAGTAMQDASAKVAAESQSVKDSVERLEARLAGRPDPFDGGYYVPRHLTACMTAAMGSAPGDDEYQVVTCGRGWAMAMNAGYPARSFAGRSLRFTPAMNAPACAMVSDPFPTRAAAVEGWREYWRREDRRIEEHRAEMEHVAPSDLGVRGRMRPTLFDASKVAAHTASPVVVFAPLRENLEGIEKAFRDNKASICRTMGVPARLMQR